MEATTSYQYKALNDISYRVLAAYVANLSANVSLYPEKLAIVIDGKAHVEVGKYIDDQALDFNIAPIELHNESLGELIDEEAVDAASLRKVIHMMIERHKQQSSKSENIIAEIAKDRDLARKDCEMYKKWYYDKSDHIGRVKEQVQALAVIIGSIFPKKC